MLVITRGKDEGIYIGTQYLVKVLEISLSPRMAAVRVYGCPWFRDPFMDLAMLPDVEWRLEPDVGFTVSDTWWQGKRVRLAVRAPRTVTINRAEWLPEDDPRREWL